MLPRNPSRPPSGPISFTLVVAVFMSLLSSYSTVARKYTTLDDICQYYWTHMSIQKRPYRMKRRAELEEQTRLRITESAVALHEEVGPALTSISAIAERAGVRRSTVYPPFPHRKTV